MTQDSSTRDDGSDYGSADGSAGPAPAATFRLVLLVVLSLLLVLSVGTFVALAVTGDSSPSEIFSDDGSGAAEKDRQDVMAQAQLFIVRVNTYGPDLLAEDGTMPKYRESVIEVISDKFAASFTDSVPAAESTVAQAGFSRTAEVFGVGVSAIDSDTATALVAGSFTNSYPVDASDLDGKRANDLPLPFRVEVKLVKVDGTWLVDAFAPVTGEDDDPSATPSGSPSASPSQEASP